MSVPHIANDLSEYQDAIGQLAYKLYTPICLCLPLLDTSSQAQIVETLTKGLERLSSSFPWLAGQVVSDGTAKDHVGGRPKIIPWEKTSRLIVKDLRNDTAAPSMETLRKAQFPFSMLDGTLFTSLRGAPTSYGESDEGPAPVFFLQANLIHGGLILSFAGEHSMMDGQGLGQVMQMLSRACHGEPFTAEELLQGNRARIDIIPLLDQSTYTPGPELDHLLVKPSTATTTAAASSPALTEPAPRCTWAYFHFPLSRLAELKSQASPSPPSTLSGARTAPYISTNDAVSAFIWQSVSRIRCVTRGPTNPDAQCTFARAVDVRPSLSVPACFPGNLSSHTYSSLALSSVPLTPLSALASSLRLALNASELAYAIRSLATYLSDGANDRSSIRYGARIDLSTDIFFSSWAKMSCYNLDFNLGLGFPVSVRRPRFDVVEGLMYLMPMDRSRGIDAAICLRDEDLEGLKLDQEFGEYAEWIG